MAAERVTGAGGSHASMPGEPALDPRPFGRALTLSEREFLSSGLEAEGFDSELARRRLERWREEHALGDDALFALRLEQEGLDPARLER
ncbi:MAG: hypothetical protein MI919_10310, partial [Holophagales bacterium]|nr:hypothetical protein [Holophagales bacterium]